MLIDKTSAQQFINILSGNHPARGFVLGSRRDIDRPADQFRSLSYAAKRIGMSTSWLYKHHHNLPFVVRIGGRLRVSKEELKKWMEQQKGGAS